jgi:predicted outer membrane repeat protein
MKKIHFIVALLFFLNISAGAKIIFVQANALGNKNGTSWKHAYSSLQQGLEKAESGDEIWVAAGIYLPTDSEDKSISFQLKENIMLYGGFKGAEKNISERNWEMNPTILSGNIGDHSIMTDNSTHVVVSANNTIVDGFIIEDGYAMGKRQSGKDNKPKTEQGKPQTHTSPDAIMQSSNTNSGGGILNFGACAIIRNSIIRNCYAGKGGGVYNMTNTSGFPGKTAPCPVFINVKFQHNYAMARGGGMENDLATNPVLINCEFTNNQCDAKGGALYNDFNCSPVLLNCIFKNNTAHDAAAMGNDGSSCPIIVNTTIVNNTAESQGAGLYQGSYNANMQGEGNRPLVIHSVIKNNKSETNGSANIVNWGEDWVYAWESDIEDFEYALTSLDDKYDALIDIAEKTKKEEASTIQEQYLPAIKSFIGNQHTQKKGERGRMGFGTNHTLSKTSSIPNNVIYVKNSSSNGDGTNWEKAFNNIQQAIDAASNKGGGEVWIAAGNYIPTDDGNRSVSFVMREHVAIYGGFTGNEKSKSERNTQINKTILSGNIGDQKTKFDNSYHVIIGSVNSIIDGLIIADGYANGEIKKRFGGGLFCWGYEHSSTVKNCLFTNNYAEDGAAVFCFQDVLSYFENVQFEQNNAFTGGAASFRFGSSCELENCTFSNNTAEARAGAIAINYGSNVVLSNSSFHNNTSKGNGGAIWVDDQASQYGGTKPLINDCEFLNNKASYYGGAIHNYNIATSQITRCLFKDNTATYGADIANTLRSQVSMSENQIKTAIYTDQNSSVFTQNVQDYDTQKASQGTTHSDFNVTIIGSGSPVYNPLRSQPSALVQYKELKFLVDMGNGTMDHLQELGLTGQNSPDALLVTHNHIDHTGEFINMVHTKIMEGKEFLIAGPSPIDQMTEYVAKFYKEDLNYRRNGKNTFDENNINASVKLLNGGDKFEYKGVEISTLEVPHSIKTLAYRFDVDGKSIVITGDLSYTEDLALIGKDADIMVIDGKIVATNNGKQTSIQNNHKKGANKAHASLEEIAKMAIACQTKTLVLTHLGPQTEDLEATKEKYASLGFKGKVIIAEDFLNIHIDGCSVLLIEPDSSQQFNKNKDAKSIRSKAISTSNENRSQNQESHTPSMAMERLDTNGDNKISEEEAKGPLKENFKALDTNKDGYINLEEIQNRRTPKR